MRQAAIFPEGIVRRTGLFVILLLGTVGLAAGGQHTTGPSTDAELAVLKAGNERCVTGRYQHPHESAETRHALSSGQHPGAAILGCADSRVPPEIVFDEGFGDLFVVRVAGNVAGNPEIASLEYAVEHLHVPLIVVLGHQKCGAVTAAVEPGEATGHLPVLVDAIRPAVEKTKGMPGNAVENAVRANVELVVEALRASRPVLAEHVEKHDLRVVGAVYSVDTGRVAWLPERAVQR